MKTPNGAEILEILLKLYAKQEHVKITYQIEAKEKNQ
jgi:hypothetical protein